MVESRLTLPRTVPAGATYESYNLYLVTGSGRNAVYTSIDAEHFMVANNTLTIDWSQLGLSDTASNRFVLRAVTDGIESLDTRMTIKFSTLKERR